MSTLTGAVPTTAVRTFPRVNLLPPEIAEEKRFGRVRLGLIGVVGVAVLSVGGLYALALGSVTDAEASLTDAQAESAGIKKETDKYRGVPAVEAATQAAETNLATAMGEEVRWSFYLNDIARTVPANVWITQVSVAQEFATLGAPPVAPVAGVPALVQPGIATVSLAGVARTSEDVAAWLDSQAGIADNEVPFLSSAADEKIGEQPVVNWNSTTAVKETAYSKRLIAQQGL